MKTKQKPTHYKSCSEDVVQDSVKPDKHTTLDEAMAEIINEGITSIISVVVFIAVACILIAIFN